MESKTKEKLLHKRSIRLLKAKADRLRRGHEAIDPLAYISELNVDQQKDIDLVKSYQTKSIVMDIEHMIHLLDQKIVSYTEVLSFQKTWADPDYVVRQNSRRIAKELIASVVRPLINQPDVEAYDEYRVSLFDIAFVIDKKKRTPNR